jgi:hypothetical protein
VACAASLLRWIYCMVVHDTSWDPAAASGAAIWRDAPQNPGGGCMTSPSCHPARVPQTFLPDEGESELPLPSGTSPA